MQVSSGDRRGGLSFVRRIAVVAAFALLTVACGGPGGDDPGPATSVDTNAPSSSAAAGTAPSTTATASEESTSTTVADTDGTEAPATTVSAGGPCQWAESSDSTTVTFVRDGRLLEVTPDGGLRCLQELPGATRTLSWAPTGGRALVDGGLVLEGGQIVDTGARGPVTGGWTWPTGLRFVQAAGDQLTKVESDGSGVIDISFLSEHGAATYHPDGLHLVVAGSGTARAEFYDEGEIVVEEWTQTGLFLVRNDGTDEQVWIDTVDARITDVAFSADGTRLTFIADHGDTRDLHSFDLPEMIFETPDGERILTALPEDPELLEPQYQTVGVLSDLVIDPRDPHRVMVTEGSCGAGGVELVDLAAGGYPIAVAPNLDAIPVGFLGPRRVAVLELDPSCDGSGALWVVDLVSGEQTLVATDVTAAATRWQAPTLRLSLQDIVIAGFA
jgi:hypothetical protein